MLELKLNQVSKQFSAKRAVNGISIQISNGVYGLLGANGAGKTTLLRMICGVLNPTSGTIQMNKEDISDMGSAIVTCLAICPKTSVIILISVQRSFCGMLDR